MNSEQQGPAAGGSPDSPPSVSRRTLVKAAAWSVPVIAVGTPAYAQSLSTIITFSGSACKLPGNSNPLFKGYVAGLTVSNNLGVNIYVVISGYKVNDIPVTDLFTGIQESTPCPDCKLSTPPIAPGTLCFPPGSTDIAVYIDEAKSSANALIEVTYAVYNCADVGGTPLIPEETLPFQLSGDPWNSGCRPHDEWCCDVPGAPIIIDDVTPNPVTCGQDITITGQNFQTAGVNEVGFTDGSTTIPAPDFTIVSDTQITAEVPCGFTDGATVAVVLASPNGLAGFPGLVINQP